MYIERTIIKCSIVSSVTQTQQETSPLTCRLTIPSEEPTSLDAVHLYSPASSACVCGVVDRWWKLPIIVEEEDLLLFLKDKLKFFKN